MFRHYHEVLKVDGEMGNKKAYDPRQYLGEAEAAMAERVKQAVEDLRATGKTMLNKRVGSNGVLEMECWSNGVERGG